MLNSKVKSLYESMSASSNRLIVIVSDLLCTSFALLYVLNLHATINTHSLTHVQIVYSFLFALLTQATCYWFNGLYRGLWRFASLPDLFRIIRACLFGTFFLWFANISLFNHVVTTLSSFPLFCIINICMLSGTRLSYRWFKDNRHHDDHGKKVLVIGAGSAGESLLRELKRQTVPEYRAVGLVDDDPSKLGMEIQGIRVLGNMNALSSIVANKAIELIIIAIPSAKATEMRRIVDICEHTGVSYRTLPSFNDVATGQMHLTNLREVSVEDLLSRDPIQFDPQKLFAVIGQKKIIVTGAGGSIGSELCRKLAACTPKTLVLIEHSEFNLFRIHSELIAQYPQLKIFPYLVSVTNEALIEEIINLHQPEYIFHAAAYKHVPLLENQIKIAVENNIFGTQIVAQAAAKYGVKKFILVSTDKAVNPSNVMGATKRCAEIICQSLNKNAETDFITVRFGNVLGSAGSVVPLFKEQIAKGGPVTITHPDMERYFMTIQEAAHLIIQTVTIENPHELYVLDMGEPVKIQYLAEQMIKLSGHVPNEDIKINYCGLRPGEKLYEELFYAHEDVMYSSQEKIMHVNFPPLEQRDYMQFFSQLKEAFYQDEQKLKIQLFKLAGILHPAQSLQAKKILA